jgi:myo-inositol-1(or 4)-monophosphatase
MSYLDTAVEAAKKAGVILQNGFSSDTSAKGKGAHDVVSEIDYESERTIIEVIKSSFPEHTIVAEESGKEQKDSEYSWYIDPLDGTSNLLLGIPYFSVSIGLAKNGEVIMGVVYNPVLNELYVAEKGKGATLNGKDIHVSTRDDIHSSFIASAYSSDENDIKRGLRTVEQLALSARKVVINFSPALDLCNIARGKLDALVDNGTTPEDHAAGSIILTEAGGTVRSYKKETWSVDEVGIIASNSLLQSSAENLAL